MHTQRQLQPSWKKGKTKCIAHYLTKLVNLLLQVLIGADGINSVVAKYLGLKKPSFSGRLATRGLAQYPTNHGFQPKLIQINGQGFRAGMIPSTEKSIYWFFAWSPSKNGIILLEHESTYCSSAH
jgi:2-polyprenyl-6-methoxyphenol hydroxylase-like FAD-dependent oxidoreductase